MGERREPVVNSYPLLPTAERIKKMNADKEASIYDHNFEQAAAIRDAVERLRKGQPLVNVTPERPPEAKTMNKYILKIQGRGKTSLIPYGDQQAMIDGVTAQYTSQRNAGGGNVTFAIDANYKVADRYEVVFTIFDENEKIVAPKFAGGDLTEIDKKLGMV